MTHERMSTASTRSAALAVCIALLAAAFSLLIAGTAQAQPAVIATIPVGTSPGGVDISSDGSKVYVVNDVSLDVSVIDTATNTVTETFAHPGGNPSTERSLNFTPDGSEVWVGSGGCVDCIRIFSYPSNAPVATVSGVIGGGTWIDFLPDGSFAFSNNGCGGCGNLQKISTTTNSVASTLFWGNSGRGLAVAPDGSAVYGATTGGGPRVHKVNPASNSSMGSVALAGDPLGVAITPDGGFLYVAITPLDQVAVVDTSSMTVVDTIAVGTGPWGVTVSPDGSRAYVANGSSDDVSVIDTASNAVAATVAVGDFPRRAAVSADGTRVYVTNTSSNTVSVIQEDSTPPTSAITTPADGASYSLGSVVLADYDCQDPGGTDVASCAGTVADGAAIDTATVGSKTFTVTATDNAGNESSATNDYGVVYDFAGFFQPVDNLPTLNEVNAGRAIPVKFSLGGFQGLSILASGYPKSEQIACSSGAQVDGIESTVTAGQSELSYDSQADRYHYAWKTSKGWAKSCRQLVVKLADGTSHRANFKFK